MKYVGENKGKFLHLATRSVTTRL